MGNNAIYANRIDMPKNKFFNTTSALNEQRLIDSIISESISIMGENVVYIPKSYVALDNFLLEDALSKYSDNFLIEAYQEIENYGFGNTQFFSKFGIVNKDKADYTISKSTFDKLISLNNLNITRPNEGDLIYNIVSSELFQITFVEEENPYRQLGGVQTYKLNCEAFKYSHQKVTATDYDIDLQVNSESTAIIIYLNTPVIGDYIINEIITSGTTTAKIIDWNAVERTITVIDRNGTFTKNTSVVGASSGVSATINSFKTVDDTNNSLDINLLLQNNGNRLISDKNNNIQGTIVTNSFMDNF